MVIVLSDIGGLAKAAAALVAAAAAIGEGFRPRSDWEPCEQDLPTVLQKVGSLIATVGIAVLFSVFASPDQEQSVNLTYIAMILVAVCVASFLFYLFLHGTCTFESPHSKKLISGFRFTQTARDLRAQGFSRTQILEHCDFNKEHIWTHSSRIVSKLLFVAAYLTLTSSGTLAIATGGLLISRSKPIPIRVKVIWQEETVSLCDTLLVFDFGKEQINRDTAIGENRLFLPRTHENDTAQLKATCGRIGRADALSMVVIDNATETVMLKKIDDRDTSKLISDGYLAIASDDYVTASENARSVLAVFPDDPEAINLASIARRSRSILHQF